MRSLRSLISVAAVVALCNLTAACTKPAEKSAGPPAQPDQSQNVGEPGDQSANTADTEPAADPAAVEPAAEPATADAAGATAEPAADPVSSTGFEPDDFYRVNCAGCHGPSGEGVEGGKAPAFKTVLHEPDEELLDAILNGKTDEADPTKVMPAFKAKFTSEEDAKFLLAWIRTNIKADG